MLLKSCTAIGCGLILLLFVALASSQDPTASGPVDYHSGQGGGSLAGGTDGSEAEPPASDTGHNGNSNGYGSDSFCCDNNNDGTGAFNPNSNSNSRVSGNSYSKANSRFTVPVEVLLFSVGVVGVLSVGSSL